MWKRLLYTSVLIVGSVATASADSPAPTVGIVSDSPVASEPLAIQAPRTLPTITTSESCPAVTAVCQPTETLCNPCAPCGPAGRCWVAGEYFYWVGSGNPLPPFITAAPNGNPVTEAGRLGSPGTQTLFGGNRANNDFRSGFRITAGTWLNGDQTKGIEADFLYLGQSRQTARAGSDGSQIISRPFFNVVMNQPDTELVSFPNMLAGTVSVDSRSDAIGGGLNFIKNCRCGPCDRLDVILGYRYFNLTDELTIREDLTSLPGQTTVPNGTRFLIEDRFRTKNNFHGGVIGVTGEKRFNRWFLGYRASVALGVNHQVTDISGYTFIQSPAPNTSLNGRYPGGLLTQPTNIGRYTNDEFAVMPEVGFRLGCRVTDHFRTYIGYNYLYLSNVQRSGDAVSLRVNPTQLAPNGSLVGTPAPVFTPKTTDFWLQGFSVGLEGRY